MWQTKDKVNVSSSVCFTQSDGIVTLHQFFCLKIQSVLKVNVRLNFKMSEQAILLSTFVTSFFTVMIKTFGKRYFAYYQWKYALLISCFFSFLSLFQIEDAMLMFDKQTNRHRGMFSQIVFFFVFSRRDVKSKPRRIFRFPFIMLLIYELIQAHELLVIQNTKTRFTTKIFIVFNIALKKRIEVFFCSLFHGNYKNI